MVHISIRIKKYNSYEIYNLELCRLDDFISISSLYMFIVPMKELGNISIELILGVNS